ncbi:hypothetical protein [Streptomyces kronopolitis]|uniref:hypothetical protein n=1 Tax=Streptomyces kronopolitis TaxID=1612435 RepID=UPI0020BEDD50|nr:hypothetical protein [Streptomyces kronopolitis]MCL6302191.1 hypothetical protein [Streptomyces kronopolitis]
MSKADGAKALKHFTEGFNEANRQLNPQLNPSFEGGALLAIDQAGIKAAHAVRPQGNPGFRALEFTDARFTVPQQKGWPKYFIANAASNRKNAAGRFTRWFLVFSRDGIDEKWRAVYLATFPGNKAPELKTDRNGYAEAVPAGAGSGLAVAPGELSRSYADYLNTGKGAVFAPGRETDGWRARRAKDANRPGVRIMWDDTAANYPPVSLRTKDGGALVFFSTVYHQQKTVFAGATITVSGALKGLLEGPPKKTNRMGFTTVSGQTVTVPPKSAGGKVAVLNRIEAKTSVRPL